MPKNAILLLLLLLSTAATAQIDRGKIAYNWLYGYGCYTTFDTTGCDPVTITAPDFRAYGSCVSISNPEGDVLFFGSNPIFNSKFEEMPNSQLLKCSGAFQNIVAIPRPTSLEEYYLLHLYSDVNPTLYTLRMSVINMTLNGGMGGLQTMNVVVTDSLRHCQTAVLHANKVDAWVILHGWNNNAFYSYLITENGVAEEPVVSAVGESGSSTPFSSSYMETSPDGTLLAFDLQDRAAVLIADFDCSTGMLSNAKTVELGIGYIFSFQISREKRFLYASKISTADKNKQIEGLYQYDLQAGTLAQIGASEIKLSETYYGDMLYGPDGRLYIAKDGYSLDYITYSEKKGLLCKLVENAIAVPNVREGLPIYVQNYTEPVIFTAEQTCFGETTLFETDYSECIDSVLWIFNDPLQTPHDTSTLFSPSFSFSAPGSYTICHISYRSSIADTAYKEVVIGELPQQYTVEGGGKYCQGSAPHEVTLSGSEVGVSYVLYKDGVETETTVNGTGAALGFGKIAEIGQYTIKATQDSGSCDSWMDSSVTVSVSVPPKANSIMHH